MFDEEENHDADFNILTLFVIKDKIKGKKSLYFPWFDIVQENYSMFSRSKQELDLLDDDSTKRY